MREINHVSCTDVYIFQLMHVIFFYSSIVYDTLICRHKLGIECAVLEGDPILMFKKHFSSPWKKDGNSWQNAVYIKRVNSICYIIANSVLGENM